MTTAPAGVALRAAFPVNVAMIDSFVLRMTPDLPRLAGGEVMPGLLATVEGISASRFVLWGGAGLALAGAAAVRVGEAGRRANAHSGARLTWPRICRGATWTVSFVTFVCLALLVGSRYWLAGQEVLRGAPLGPRPGTGLGLTGLITAGALLLTGRLLHRGSRDAKWPVLVFWAAILAALCTALLVPTHYPTETGSYVRSAWTLLLTAGVVTVLCATIGLGEVAARRRRRRATYTDAAGLIEPEVSGPGIRVSCGAAALWLVLLTCYGLAGPVELHPGGYALGAIVLSAAAAAGGVAVFVLVTRHWSVLLADGAMGLITLAVCCGLTAFVPSEPRELAARSPMTLNAITFGLAAMAWTWSWLSRVWEQQLDDGRAWTTAGRLVSPARDFSFLVAAVALTLALLMAGWPLIPGIAALDSSRGRILFGVAGHLLLLLSILSCARRSKRAPFTGLAALVVVSLLLFLGVRAIG